jgi:type IV secretion system protein VirB10
MLGAATLLSVIGASAANVGVHATDSANSIASYREGSAKSFGDASNTVLGEFVKIKPTITVQQGQRIKVFVSRDLYFDAVPPDTNQVQFIR